MKASRVSWTAVALAIVCSSSPLSAAPAAFADGVKAYNARQYSVALGYFGEAARTAPSDPSVHYYMGLCYQGTNQMSQARQQYEWVATQGSNPALRGQALAALGQLSQYKKTWQSSNGTSAASNSLRSVAPPPKTAGGNSPPPPMVGKMQILEFYTDWCVPCHQFEPIWQSVSARMSSKADFKRYNAEAPENAELRTKFGIRGFPTIVFTDGKGQELQRISGAPDNEETFISAINSIRERAGAR